MKRTLIIFILLTILTPNYGQTNSKSFYLYYGFAGMGSNMGSMEPTFHATGAKFVYTFEQNSYYGEKTKKPDTISMGILSTTSIDSITDLVKGLKDTLIYKSNPCTMSGGIHFMTIAIGTDTTRYELKNTYDSISLSILNILNDYLPADKKIWADAEMIRESEDCWARLLKTKPMTVKKKKRK